MLLLLGGCGDPPKPRPADPPEPAPDCPAETCNGRDDDCDGQIDEEPTDAETWYPDADGDGWGDPGAGVESCDRPSGYLRNGDDCDDTDADVSPTAGEACDGEDNDCDGEVDERVLESFYPDRDGDGYGDEAGLVEACLSPGDTYITDAGDCDDADPKAHEIESFYPDLDHDGYGDDAGAMEACGRPDPTYTTVAGDCDDADAEVNPEGRDNCDAADGLDNDCDDYVDECCYPSVLDYEYGQGFDPGYRDCTVGWRGEWCDAVPLCVGCEFGFTAEYAEASSSGDPSDCPSGSLSLNFGVDTDTTSVIWSDLEYYPWIPAGGVYLEMERIGSAGDKLSFSYGDWESRGAGPGTWVTTYWSGLVDLEGSGI